MEEKNWTELSEEAPTSNLLDCEWAVESFSDTMEEYVIIYNRILMISFKKSPYLHDKNVYSH